jgi:hypothetical protein
LQPSVRVGDAKLGEHVRLPYGTLCVVTGGYGSGKSAFAQNIAFHAAAFPDEAGNNHPVSLTAFEDKASAVRNTCIRFLNSAYETGVDLGSIRLGEEVIRVETMSKPVFDAYDRIIWHHTEELRERGLDRWLEDIQFEHKRYGSRLFVLDPWNSHQPLKETGETDLSYVNRVTNELQFLAADMNVVIILLTHTPISRTPSRTEYERMTMHSAAGSGDFAARAGVGICIQRTNFFSRLIDTTHDQHVPDDSRIRNGELLAQARSIAASKPFVPAEHMIVTIDKVKLEGIEGKRGVLCFWVDRLRGSLVHDEAATILAHTLWEA